VRAKDGTGHREARPSAPTAGDLGWDDSLYDGEVPGPRRADGDDGADGGGPDGPAPGRPAPRRRRRVLRWAALSLSVLVLGTAGAGYLYYEHLNGNLDKDPLNLADNKLDRSGPNAAGQHPLNILLLGSDSRNTDANVELGGARDNVGRPPLADVQMLLHVSADRSNMSVVSIPRDTRVTIPKCTDPDDGTVYQETVDRINTSLQHGGPGCTVATWETLTGVPVDHFMMIDFAGVVSMADAVGGVPVCVRANVHDERSGLRLEKGTSVVKGEQALQWLRTRHGFEDGSDIGRARAQHMYMSAMVRQLKAGTKLSDPGKLNNLAEAATKALTVDHGLGSVGKLYDLAGELKRVPAKRLTMATMPWVYSPGGSYVLPKEGEAERLFSLIRNDVALDGKDKADKDGGDGASREPADPAAPPERIAVTVMNGTGTAAQPAVTGRAGALVLHLAQQGFTQAAADATPKSQHDTALTYATPGQRGDALAVAKALNLPERLVKHSAAVTGVTLVIGADWREGTAYPADAAGDTDPADERTPGSARALNGADEKACMEVNPAHTW
jgi:LCP family protein required for cell wall assembly